MADEIKKTEEAVIESRLVQKAFTADRHYSRGEQFKSADKKQIKLLTEQKYIK